MAHMTFFSGFSHSSLYSLLGALRKITRLHISECVSPGLKARFGFRWCHCNMATGEGKQINKESSLRAVLRPSFIRQHEIPAGFYGLYLSSLVPSQTENGALKQRTSGTDTSVFMYQKAHFMMWSNIKDILLSLLHPSIEQHQGKRSSQNSRHHVQIL